MNAANDKTYQDPIDVAVGETVRRLRKSRGWSQDELAGQVGLTAPQLQKYEQASNKLPVSMMCHIAHALGVRPSTLLPEESGCDEAAKQASPCRSR